MSQLTHRTTLFQAFGVVDKIISERGGGVIFMWHPNEEDVPGVVKIPFNLLPCQPTRGETWRVDGHIVETNWGRQLEALDCGRTLPSSSMFIEYISKNPKYLGISKGRADNLWKAFGESIFDVLSEGDSAYISSQTNIPRKIVKELCDTWKCYEQETKVIAWLQSCNLPTRLAFKIFRLYGEDAVDLLEQDPYRMLAVSNWKSVDSAAMLLGVSPDDDRRYVAAVSAVMYERWKKGHTATDKGTLVLSLNRDSKLGRAVDCESVIEKALARNEIIDVGGGKFQNVGAHLLESFIASFIKGQELPNNIFSTFCPNRLKEFESAKSKKLGYPFKLNDQQVSAVRVLLEHPFSCVTGGGGVGKTTILEAVYFLLDAPESVIQCALTGRAQRRMTEATGYPAMTIARLIAKAEYGDILPGSIIFIDESSMLDVPLFARLIRSLPEVEIHLIGDARQLPPIGAGLVFHLCVNSKDIPVIELTEIHRASAATEIPQASGAIRNQQMPKLDEFKGLKNKDYGLSLVPALGSNKQVNAILRCYRELEDFGEVQILAYRNQTCDIINGTLHNEYCEYIKSEAKHPSVVGRSHEPITEGEPIIWVNINDYSRELYNGSMGTLTNIYARPEPATNEDGREVAYVAEAMFDGCGKVRLTDDDFQNIKLAYCVTGHKAKGSQWERVIVAIEDTGTIDNSWIYTSVTRTKRQAICVGDPDVFKRLVCSEPTAFTRCVGLNL